MTVTTLDPYGTDAHKLVPATDREAHVSTELVPLRDMVLAHSAELEALLPSGVELKRVLAELYIAARKSPLLLKVAAAELIPAIGNALQRGGIIGQDSYLVPFFSKTRSRYEVSVMDNYQFRQQLVVAAGGARSFESRAVYSKESFEVHYGTDARIVHVPRAPEVRGGYRGSYTIARLGHGECKFIWLELADIEETRKKSRDWNPSKVKDCPPWYGHKTSSNLCIKGMLSNPKLRAIGAQIEAAEHAEFGDATEGTFTEIQAEDAPRPPSVDADGVDLSDDVTLDALGNALGFRVKGQALGDMNTDRLEKLGAWAVSKDKLDLAQMCALVLDDRAALADEIDA